MKYLSVCSGIEAATVAWHPLGWEPVGFAEIEPFPAAVLAHHYPNVPNFGDMTNYKEWDLGAVELLVGGTPCQSFSVAGLRKGLADPRGNLALVYCGILDHFRPQWCVWENVPGVLSSNGGRDFGSFLGALAELGYGFAYRVLDAQYFGVAQRRRRVFVVGYLGDWRPAAEVLFEPESLRGNPAPSRETWQKPAGTIEASLGRSRGAGTPTAAITTARMVAFGEYVDDGTASAMKARDYKDATDLVAQPIAFSAKDHGADATTDLAPTMRAMPHNGSHANGGGQLAVAQPIAFTQNQRDEVRELQVAGALAAEPGMKQQTFLAQPVCVTGNITHTLKAEGFDASEDGTGRGQPIVAQPITESGELASTLRTGGNDHADVYNSVAINMAVRRLTPVECERLQGFPDGYTNIPWRKQPESPDGPRYKALGNSMAVPVMAWIGRRIAMYNTQSARMVA